ncbi:hypothetical protein JCM8097_006281 [Rhodosporidiobolus ruineniae]
MASSTAPLRPPGLPAALPTTPFTAAGALNLPPSSTDGNCFFSAVALAGLNLPRSVLAQATGLYKSLAHYHSGRIDATAVVDESGERVDMEIGVDLITIEGEELEAVSVPALCELLAFDGVYIEIGSIPAVAVALATRFFVTVLPGTSEKRQDVPRTYHFPPVPTATTAPYQPVALTPAQEGLVAAVRDRLDSPPGHKAIHLFLSGQHFEATPKHFSTESARAVMRDPSLIVADPLAAPYPHFAVIDICSSSRTPHTLPFSPYPSPPFSSFSPSSPSTGSDNRDEYEMHVDEPDESSGGRRRELAEIESLSGPPRSRRSRRREKRAATAEHEGEGEQGQAQKRPRRMAGQGRNVQQRGEETDGHHTPLSPSLSTISPAAKVSGSSSAPSSADSPAGTRRNPARAARGARRTEPDQAELDSSMDDGSSIDDDSSSDDSVPRTRKGTRVSRKRGKKSGGGEGKGSPVASLAEQQAAIVEAEERARARMMTEQEVDPKDTRTPYPHQADLPTFLVNSSRTTNRSRTLAYLEGLVRSVDEFVPDPARAQEAAQKEAQLRREVEEVLEGEGIMMPEAYWTQSFGCPDSPVSEWWAYNTLDRSPATFAKRAQIGVSSKNGAAFYDIFPYRAPNGSLQRKVYPYFLANDFVTSPSLATTLAPIITAANFDRLANSLLPPAGKRAFAVLNGAVQRQEWDRHRGGFVAHAAERGRRVSVVREVHDLAFAELERSRGRATLPGGLTQLSIDFILEEDQYIAAVTEVGHLSMFAKGQGGLAKGNITDLVLAFLADLADRKNAVSHPPPPSSATSARPPSNSHPASSPPPVPNPSASPTTSSRHPSPPRYGSGSGAVSERVFPLPSTLATPHSCLVPAPPSYPLGVDPPFASLHASRACTAGSGATSLKSEECLKASAKKTVATTKERDRRKPRAERRCVKAAANRDQAATNIAIGRANANAHAAARARRAASDDAKEARREIQEMASGVFESIELGDGQKLLVRLGISVLREWEPGQGQGRTKKKTLAEVRDELRALREPMGC